MPAIGHALVGVAVGAATAHAPRSRVLRRAWLGLCVLLAMLPDVAEWTLAALGAALPHSAIAGLPVALGAAAACMLLTRCVLGDRWLVSITAAVALLSHTLLDAVDGGIPLLWPFSPDVIGATWITPAGAETGARLARELALFVPIAIAGLAAAAWRNGPAAGGVAALGFVGSLLAGLIGDLPGAALISASALVAAAATLPWPPSHVPWQALQLLPAALFAAAHAHGRWQMSLGHAARERGDAEAALRHYALATQYRPMDLGVDPDFWTARVLIDAGRSGRGRRQFESPWLPSP